MLYVLPFIIVESLVSQADQAHWSVLLKIMLIRVVAGCRHQYGYSEVSFVF